MHFRLMLLAASWPLAIATISLIGGALAWQIGQTTSPVIDEPGHLAAGLTLWRHGRVDFYAVNPPLTRSLIGAVARPDADWSWELLDREAVARPAASLRREFPVSQALFDENGWKAWEALFRARLVGCLFVVLGGLGCAAWANALAGRWAGLLAVTLWSAEPLVLGHGALITPDVPAAAAGIWAGYASWRWLRQPTVHGAVVAGVALGLATLTKFTVLLLWPVWVGLWLIYRVLPMNGKPVYTEVPRSAESRPRELVQLAGMFAAALAVVHAGYLGQGVLVPLERFQFASPTFAGPKTDAVTVGNRFRGTWAGKLPVPLPYDFVVGLDAQRADLERPWRCYMRGVWQDGGWWYFYLYGLAVKLPVGTWGLLAVAVACAAFRWNEWRTICLLLAPVTAIIATASWQTTMTIHVRYLLPALPFLFVFASWAVMAEGRWSSARRVIGVLGATAVVSSSALAYPHSLSYFNEWAGGLVNGPEQLLDSNSEWGQELPALANWLEEHPTSLPLYVAAYNSIDPRPLGLEFSLPQRKAGAKAGSPIPPGRYALSVHYLFGGGYHAPDGRGGREYIRPDELTHFRQLTPVARIGGAMWVFDIHPTIK